jgi:hypothetical protein
VYRAGLIPALLAIVVAAFSLREPPRALTATLAPDSFSGQRALTGLRALADAVPERQPGSDGDAALADRVLAELHADGFARRVTHEDARTADGVEELTTVVGTRAGRSNRRIVVVAHRDALAKNATADLSATATLIELAHVFKGRILDRTIVLASTSGASGGAGGAQALAKALGSQPVDAVIVLGDLAGKGVRRPFVVPWSSGAAVTPIQLRRTLDAAIRTETGLRPGSVGPFMQFARIAFPVTTAEQGPLLEHDLPAALVSVSGERGPGAARAIDADRFRQMGRAVLRAITAIDSRPGPSPRPTRDIEVARKVLPAWAIQLLVAGLMLPVLLVAIDGSARARRRRHEVGMWLSWVIAGATPFAVAGGVAVAIGALGLGWKPPSVPVPPGARPFDAAAGAQLGLVPLVALLGWLGLRPLVIGLFGVRGDPESPGAAAAVIAVLAATLVGVWVSNPFAAALLLPFAHAAVIVAAPEIRLRRGAATILLVLSFLPIVAVWVWLGNAVGASLLELPWFGLQLVEGGHVGLPAVLAGSLIAGVLGSLLAIVRRQPGLDDPPASVTRGPRSYAGPGSLGGTESALRR